jgi:hypothetical protein
MKTLRVHLPEDECDTLRMAWAAGLATVLHAHPDVRDDVDRWLQRGLMEFVRDSDGGLTQRITESSEPLFLDHIAESLRTQFGYRAEVREEALRTVEPPPFAAIAAAAIAVGLINFVTMPSPLQVSRARLNQLESTPPKNEVRCLSERIFLSAGS